MAKVLIVDDEPDLRSLMAHVAREAGHDVRVASNGREAMAAVEAEVPQVIVLDIHMPLMGGLEVLEALWVRALQTGTPPIPAIMMTADTDAKLVRLTGDLGAKEFYIKGQVEPEQLEEAIRRIAIAA